jgi:hypothetical protein
MPATTRGTDADDETREASFCYIENAARQAIMNWLLKKNVIGFHPTIIPVSRANKDLSSISAHPTLGVDSTLPQYRATDSSTVFTPTQDQYPVWYFFYGSLADADILLRRLSLFQTASISSSQYHWRHHQIVGRQVRSSYRWPCHFPRGWLGIPGRFSRV